MILDTPRKLIDYFQNPANNIGLDSEIIIYSGNADEQEIFELDSEQIKCEKGLDPFG